MEKENAELRKHRLVIRAFHIGKVCEGMENSLLPGSAAKESGTGAGAGVTGGAGLSGTGARAMGSTALNSTDAGSAGAGGTDMGAAGSMTVCADACGEILAHYPRLADIRLHVIKPGMLDRRTETIMDVIPISTKALGVPGEGITHTLTGVYVLLTGVDTEGKQAHEFGSSEGRLSERLYLNRAGTPSEQDFLISFDVTLKAGQGQEREGILEAHRACDEFLQLFRQQMKRFRAESCTEEHIYYDTVRPGKKRVLIVKQVAGQGAMYDTWLFPQEPSGAEGGISIIDMGNMPVILTPNEYRDGMIRSMQ